MNHPDTLRAVAALDDAGKDTDALRKPTVLTGGRLMRKLLRREALVMRGELIPFSGDAWVVTGWDAERRVVFIARDMTLKQLTAEDAGLYWEGERAA